MATVGVKGLTGTSNGELNIVPLSQIRPEEARQWVPVLCLGTLHKTISHGPCLILLGITSFQCQVSKVLLDSLM